MRTQRYTSAFGFFLREDIKMNKIKIAIECIAKHKACIYALVTSIKVNKNKNSIYDIYILANGTDKSEWEMLTTLNDENTNVYIKESGLDSLKDVDKLIKLKWNTLVMGDLSGLYNIDLEGKSFAATSNFPEKLYNIPTSAAEFNSSVLLIDMKKERELAEYKELSGLYNLGYEEFVNNRLKISQDGLDTDKKDNEYKSTTDWALVLRMDEKKSPDKFFDSPLSELWIKYYKMSPIGHTPLKREAYVETIGDVKRDLSKAIPILIYADDKRCPYVIALIGSLEDKLDNLRTLDIRIVYNQLSISNKDMLLGLRSDKVSVVLYNVNEYYKNSISDSYELLTSLVFAEYEKALYIYNDRICMEDISKLYDKDMEDCLILHTEDLSFLLINVVEWNKKQICGRIHDALNDEICKKYSTKEIVDMACIKNTKIVNDEILWFESDKNQHVYEELVDKYILKTPWSEKIKDTLAFYATREDDNVKEVLEKIQKLEVSNAKLRERNKELTAENGNLTEEKDRYLYEILEIRKSITYRLGRAITFIPRKLRGK